MGARVRSGAGRRWDRAGGWGPPRRETTHRWATSSSGGSQGVLWWVTGGDTSCALRSFDHHLRQSEPPTNNATPTSHILFSSPMNCCNLCKRLFQQIEMLNAKAIECGPAWYSLNYKQPLGFSNLFKHDKIENWRGLNLFKCRPREWYDIISDQRLWQSWRVYCRLFFIAINFQGTSLPKLGIVFY